MPDPNFEIPSRPGPRVFGQLPSNPPGANTQLEAGIGQQLGQDPGNPNNVVLADLRKFVNKDYSVRSFSLAAPRNNEIVIFPRQFSFIWVPNSTNVDDVLNIRIGSASNDPIPFLPGTKINGIPFEFLYLTNAAIAGATMSIMFAENWPIDQIDTDS